MCKVLLIMLIVEYKSPKLDGLARRCVCRSRWIMEASVWREHRNTAILNGVKAIADYISHQ
jgi:hypothetical protein